MSVGGSIKAAQSRKNDELVTKDIGVQLLRLNMQTKKPLLFAIACGLLQSGPILAAEDDFLSAIEAESEKVDARQETDKKKTTGSAEVDEASRDEFEKILAEKYQGSFKFYSKLPERSRQEIVQEYERGTSFVKLRKKIIDRFMQR